MLPYLTDYENDRRLFRPRMVNAILVLLPFMVLSARQSCGLAICICLIL